MTKLTDAAAAQQTRLDRIAELEFELSELKTPLCPKHGIRYNVLLDPACPQCALQRGG